MGGRERLGGWVGTLLCVGGRDRLGGWVVGQAAVWRRGSSAQLWSGAISLYIYLFTSIYSRDLFVVHIHTVSRLTMLRP